MKKKILVFKIGALGDILMSTPFLRELRKANKDAQIDFLVGNNCRVILENNIQIDNIISFDQNIFLKKNMYQYYNLIKKIKKITYDEIYILDKHWIFNMFAFLTRIPKRIGFIRDKLSKVFLTTYINYTNDKHEVDFYLELIKSKTKNKKIEFGEISQSDKTYVDSILKVLCMKKFKIFVNLGGNELEKSSIRKIPDFIFKNILRNLSKKNVICLIGGPDDFLYYNSFVLNSNIINLSGKFSIAQTIYFMEKSSYIYSTDCGPMHFGACTNTAMTCFFGPSNPLRKAPLRSGIISLWSDSNIYDPEYELNGKIPTNKLFFRNLDIDKI